MANGSSLPKGEAVWRLPKRLAGQEVVVVAAREYSALKNRVHELEDAIGKIRRGEKALSDGKTEVIGKLSELDG